jgi:methionyl-tRNA formyltransferase
VTVLERLADSPHRPGLVLTRPDRPRGRGRKPAPPPAAVAARELGIDLLQPERLNDALDRIAAVEPAAVVVCAYGALVREPLLSAHEMLNVHPSLLPRWRGAAPIERALMAGDPETGASILRLTAELDSGPICAQESEAISPGDTYGTLAPRLAAIGARLLVASLDDPPAFVPQTEAGVTYAEKIAPADRLLDPARPPGELERVVRALDPHIGARIGELRVIEARVPAEDDGLTSPPPAPPAGELAAANGRLLFGTEHGALELLRVQPPGGRPMGAADYLRGHAV